MANTRKRNEPSAGTDESSDDHSEEGGPSKKTATQHFNVKSSENIPLPRSGTIPVVTMIICLGEREEVTRILLDTGSTVPLLSQNYARIKLIPVAERLTVRPIQGYAGQEVEGAGIYYTAPLKLQPRHHFSRVSFEVAPLASDYDAILPRWWLAKHKCDLLASNGRIKFTSAECQRRCTEERQLHFPDETPRTSAAATEEELQAAID